MKSGKGHVLERNPVEVPPNLLVPERTTSCGIVATKANASVPEQEISSMICKQNYEALNGINNTKFSIT